MNNALPLRSRNKLGDLLARRGVWSFIPGFRSRQAGGFGSLGSWLLLSWLGGLALEAAGAETAGSIVGRWQFKNQDIEVVAEFTAEGAFSQTTVAAGAREAYAGRYQLTGQELKLQPQGLPESLVFNCRFLDADTLLLSDPAGVGVQMKRIKPAQPSPAPNDSKPDKPILGETSAAIPKTNAEPAGANASAPTGTNTPAPGAPAKKPLRLVMQRTWEPNERAFTFLLPKGWQMTGGIFNVNPLQMNGPGNTLAPKCDLSLKNDERGTIMFRWGPSWNYADLTYSATGTSFFTPGSYYRGMLVRPLITARQFLLEFLKGSRPQATDVKVVAEDPMREVVEAIQLKNQQLNQQLLQMGLKPNQYEALAMLVDYTESGQRYREALSAVLTDCRGSAFMWVNESTVTFRAPAAEYETWKPVFDTIKLSLQANPQWLAAVRQAITDRTRMDRETQSYINKVANEIVENRRRTHAEIRHENWLFITGQNEFKNPFNGQTERDTDYYRYRWVNNQGDVLYTDENSFDPNRYEEYNTREWKKSLVRER